MCSNNSLFSCYTRSTVTESRSVRQELARASTATESKAVRPKLPRASDRKFLTGSQSTPLFPRLQVTNVIEGIVGAGAEFLQEFWISQDIYGSLFHLLCIV